MWGDLYRYSCLGNGKSNAILVLRSSRGYHGHPFPITPEKFRVSDLRATRERRPVEWHARVLGRTEYSQPEQRARAQRTVLPYTWNLTKVYSSRY